MIDSVKKYYKFIYKFEFNNKIYTSNYNNRYIKFRYKLNHKVIIKKNK